MERDRVSRLQRYLHRLGRTEHPGKLWPDRNGYSGNHGFADRSPDRASGSDYLAQSAGHRGSGAWRARELRAALRGLLPAFAAGLTLAGPAAGLAGYAPPVAGLVDSIRHSKVPVEFSTRTVPRTESTVIRGYLSAWGLPPVEGDFTLGDSVLVFRSSEGATSTWSSAVSLAYVDQDQGRRHYLFRVGAGVFETDAPGALLQIAERRKPIGVNSVKGAWSPVSGSVAISKTTHEIATSAYADTLYRLFGKPRAPVGVVGARGRRAGRLGEYIAAKDSLALDPGRMRGEAQLRHAMAHELGHRWQARARAQMAVLWTGVPSIRDPKRYGYGERSEHQAEAIAFAVHYLQTTAASRGVAEASLSLLDHYELLVPGTRAMVRHLLLQSVYRRHPLRSQLAIHGVTYALEK